MAFYTGQKVTFVGNGKFETLLKVYPDLQVPKYGTVYTIRETFTGSEGIPALLLMEIVNPPRKFSDVDGEVNWYQEEFRPLVDKQTDISLFEEIVRRQSGKITTH